MRQMEILSLLETECSQKIYLYKRDNSKSLNCREFTTIEGTITVKGDNVTIDGFTVEATDDTAPVIHNRFRISA